MACCCAATTAMGFYGVQVRFFEDLTDNLSSGFPDLLAEVHLCLPNVIGSFAYLLNLWRRAACAVYHAEVLAQLPRQPSA